MVNIPGGKPHTRTLPAHPGGRRNVQPLPLRRTSLPEYIYEWLRSTFNLTAAQASGVLGNFQTESGFNPHAYNAYENAHGFAQWENAGGGPTGRWTNLQNFAAAHHLDPTSVPAELGYLRKELSGPYSGVLADLRRTTSAQAAAQVIQSEFEGSTVDSLPQRETNAAAIFARVTQGLEPIAGAARSVTITGRHVQFAGVGAGGFDGGAGFSGSGGAAPGIPVPKLPFAPNQYRTGFDAPAAVVARMRAFLTKAWGGAIDFSKLGNKQIVRQYNIFAIASKKGGVVQGTNGGPLGTIENGILHVGEAAGKAANALPDWITGLLAGLFGPLGRWLADALLIVLGIVFVVLALWLVAKSSGATDAAGSSSTPEHEKAAGG